MYTITEMKEDVCKVVLLIMLFDTVFPQTALEFFHKATQKNLVGDYIEAKKLYIESL